MKKHLVKIITIINIVMCLVSLVGIAYTSGTFEMLKNTILQHRNYRDIREYIFPADEYETVTHVGIIRLIDTKNRNRNIVIYDNSSSLMRWGTLSSAEITYTLNSGKNINVNIHISLSRNHSIGSYDDFSKRLRDSGYKIKDCGMGLYVYYYETLQTSVVQFYHKNVMVEISSYTIDDVKENVLIDFAKSYQQWFMAQFTKS